MLNKVRYILLCIALLCSLKVAGQMAMPDNVCVGQTKHYNVDPNPVPGSTYTWWINGAVQTGAVSNFIDHTWNTQGTYLIEVQELDANGCLGPRRSGQVFVNELITPEFTQLGPYCMGATPGALPMTSNNGITGTWSPATISTAAAGTATYTFTPAAGQCGAAVTMDITVTASITPVFDPIGPLCQGSTPPALPLTSNNGITGTWAPAAISTAAAGTATYTFTPDAGQCGAAATMDITVTTSITPVFDPIGPLCQGWTPPVLPLTSNNGITGTWAPAAISTAAAGTATYTFTPAAGQCGAAATMDITVAASITPTFTQPGPLPQNSIAPLLPTTSLEGITGTWDPATINTAVAGTFTFSFTPAGGQCGTVTTMNIVILPVTGSLSVTKSSSETSYSAEGNQIHYTITVTNTGSTAITDISVTDPLTALNQIIGSLSAGSSRTFNQTYTVTAAEVTAGQVINTATASYTLGGNNFNVSASHTVPAQLTGNALAITKTSAETSYSAQGNQIHYTIVVTNTGRVTLTDISVSDPLTGLNQVIGSLLPGASRTFNATYTVSAADIAAGQIVNTATASYIFNNNNFSETARHTVSGTASGNDLGISKTSLETGFAQPGDQVHYTIIVTNTGSVTLTNITVSDPLTGLNRNIASLAPGVSSTINTTYTVTAADINAGRVVNTATATYTYAGNNYHETASHTVSVNAGPGISVSKRTGASGFSYVGEVITYTIVVTNTGNVTLTNISVTDPLTGMNQNVASLAAGSSTTLTTRYTVNQNDLNRGSIANTVRASCVFGGNTYSDTDNVTVSGNAGPDLSIYKTARETSFTAAGQVLNYTIVVTNTGNVTLSNISVTDPTTGLNQTIASLDPGASRTFATTHTTTQNDLNNGQVYNIATATCTFNGNRYTDSDNATVTADIRPGIGISKSSAERNFTVAGDVIHYTIVVTNTGNVTLTGVTVSDPNTILACSGAPYTLAPGGRATCTATHTITVADMNNGSYSNRASVTGYDPLMNSISETSNEVTVTLINSPPVISCPRPITVNAPPTSCQVELTSGLAATFSDPNNNISSVTWVMSGATNGSSPSSGINNLSTYTFNGGVTTVTYTVTDVPGLSASCSFTVTVNDITDPTISCVGPQDRFTDTDGPNYTVQGTEFDPLSADDNCSVASLVNDFNNASTLAGAEFPAGTTTVRWTVTDGAGRTASCSFTVTVVDNVPPVAICRNIDVYLDLNSGTVSIEAEDVDGGSYDNTAVGSLSIDRSTFDCEDLGPNNVVLTVTDIYDNSSTCTAVVTVHYMVVPNPVVTPATDVVCNNETINLVMTSNMPVTTWTWTVNAPAEISGASGDNTGLNSSIVQTLGNSGAVVHEVVYEITPTVYGKCQLPAISSSVWVNPEPVIGIHSNDTIVCHGESTLITVQNPNTTVRGQWMYDLVVEPDAEVTGYSAGGTFTMPVDLNETLFNDDIIRHKVVYRFTPRIVPDDGGRVCEGQEVAITIWANPRIRYNTEISNYNGFNVSCYGKSNGYIRIDPHPEMAPYTFRWTGPEGFTSDAQNISGRVAGHYEMTITDRYGCSAVDDFDLTEPGKLSMAITTSSSRDGNYNIDCYGGQNGAATITAVNNVGLVDYMWSDGYLGNTRANMSAGTHKIIISDSNSCLADSTVTLTEPDKIKIEFIVTPAFCPDKPDGDIGLVVTGGISGGDYFYRWSDNSTDKNLSHVAEGTYSVTVTDFNGCSVTGEVQAGSMHKMCLVIPEAFSPNNDLINDTWNIDNADLYPQIEISVFNRWGQTLWVSEKGYPVQWDGRSRGEGLPVDSYHYVIDLHNGSRLIVGTVTIMK